jgi:type I restriction enzyme S subunit
MEEQTRFGSIVEQADKSKFGDFKSQFIEMFGTVENNTHNFPIMTIGEFAYCFAGATPSTSHPEYWENGRIRWMSSGEVHKGHVEDTDSRITELGYKSASTRMVPIHSIVIAIAGQGKTRGTVAITEVDLCTNQSLCAIVPDERVNYSYLYHNLQGRYLELRGLSGDVNGRGGLNLKIIQKIPVILPPIEKQQQFASIAQQADKSKFELRKSIDAIDKVIKSLINN